MRFRRRASPSGVMPPSERPFCSRMSASASAVPDDACASVQWRRENSRAIASTSTFAWVSAASNASFASVPPGKNRAAIVTQPSLSDSRRSGCMPRPMMNSVEPPPMSTTSRGASPGGSRCATPT